MKKLIWMPVLLLVLVMMSSAVLAQDNDEAMLSGTPDAICESALPAEEPETRQFDAAPELALDPAVDYYAIFCTEEGAVYVDLFENYVPVTVNNFVTLSNNGYYNNSDFHRVLENFMAQGGDPVGNPVGTGNPGYAFQDEFPAFLTFDRTGLLAMANSGPNTNGGQFFITTSLPSHLTYVHTIFGEVVSGYENVENLKIRDPQTQPDGETSGLDTVIIITDPSAVETDTEMMMMEVADSETMLEAMSQVTAQLPEDLALIEDLTGIFSADDVVAAAPEDVQDDYAAYLDEYGHQYRVGSGVDNAACTTDAFFTNLSYSVDAFADADSALAAYQDEFLVTLNEADGFSTEGRSDSLWIPLFTTDTTDCADGEATEIRGYFLRGPYVVTAGALVPNAILEQVPADALLDRGVAQIFESALIDQYRPQ
ncbi:MAG: peptidylprolyl isomerase [Aggregatilineales bacterium]